MSVRAIRPATSRRRLLLAGAIALAAGCRQREGVPAPVDSLAPTLAPTPTATVAPTPAPTPAETPMAGSVLQESSASDDGEPLIGEERERDPRSETVTIRVTVDPPRKAHVLWGRKDFGEAPLEIVRPRNSGPLDLVVNAPGYLPLHARAFTDRDDKLALRIYAAEEAPQLLGYRSEQKMTENRPQKAAPDRSRGDAKTGPKKK